MTGETLWISILAGLSGAPHCIIMCGGIGTSIAMEAKQSPLRSLLAYHCGRILTYSVTGAFMGAVGSFLNVAGQWVSLQGAASIAGGLFILMWALRRYSLPLHAFRIPGQIRLQRFAERIKPSFEHAALFMTGLLLGLLPCGLTYAMQIRAAATGSWVEGFSSLLVFGVATLPILVIVSLSAKGLSNAWKRSMRKTGHYLAVMMGLLSILKGLSVNGWIPSVHPWLW